MRFLLDLRHINYKLSLKEQKQLLGCGAAVLRVDAVVMGAELSNLHSQLLQMVS